MVLVSIPIIAAFVMVEILLLALKFRSRTKVCHSVINSSKLTR